MTTSEILEKLHFAKDRYQESLIVNNFNVTEFEDLIYRKNLQFGLCHFFETCFTWNIACHVLDKMRYDHLPSNPRASKHGFWYDTYCGYKVVLKLSNNPH